MATLQEYFKSDFDHCFRLGRDWIITDRTNGKKNSVRAELCIDTLSCVRYFTIFIPEDLLVSEVFLTVVNSIPGALKELNEQLFTQYGNASDKDFGEYKSEFCNRIYIYADGNIDDLDLTPLNQLCSSNGYYLTVRDHVHRDRQNTSKKPLAFISHDSRDKALVAEPLALELSKRMCPVWYDEYSLKIGDDIRESIELGLKECKKCVLVLSSSFFSNNGWTKKEFNTIIQKEIMEGRSSILPIWYGVTKEDVYEYSPELLNRKGYIWIDDVEDAAAQLHKSILID